MMILTKSNSEYRDCWVQFSLVTQSCPTLCDPMNCSTPGLPVYYQLLESTQTHVHWVSDAIQPSRPLSSPSPPFFNLSQHQLLFFFFQIIPLVQFSSSVMSDSFRSHGLQHSRPPCPSPTPRVYSNSCPLSRWCHPTISCSVVRFSSRLQSFPASDLFKQVSSLHQVAKVLEFQLQHQFFLRTGFF